MLRCAVRKAGGAPYSHLFAGIFSRASCHTKDLSRFYTKCLLHAELRNFSAWIKSEVNVMATRTLTKQERQVAAIVEQTLNEMIETKLTIAEIMEAAATSAQRSRNEAITVLWT